MENFLRFKEYWNLIEHGTAAIRGGGVQTMAQQQKALEEEKMKDLKVNNYMF